MKNFLLTGKRGMALAALVLMMSFVFTNVTGVMVYANSTTSSTTSTTDKTAVDLTEVTNPIIGLLKSIMGPIIAVVGAVGAVYCIFLGVKFAKAEEPQEREKAKSHLKNAIIGFVLIFVLVVALNQALPILEKWMNRNM